MALSGLLRKVVERFLWQRLCPPGGRWCGVLGFVPEGNVSSSSTLQIYRDALPPPFYLLGHFARVRPVQLGTSQESLQADCRFPYKSGSTQRRDGKAGKKRGGGGDFLLFFLPSRPFSNFLLPVHLFPFLALLLLLGHFAITLLLLVHNVLTCCWTFKL